jgi:hypothetical protein
MLKEFKVANLLGAQGTGIEAVYRIREPWFGRAGWRLWAASDRATCSEKASIPLSLRSDYTAEYPPSTGKVAPVIHDDSSLAK